LSGMIQRTSPHHQLTHGSLCGRKDVTHPPKPPAPPPPITP